MAQLAAIDLTLATLVGVHNGLGLRPLLRYAPDPLRRQWLPALASGRQLAAYALSEPQAGSNPRAIGSRAARVDGGWRLDGEKHLIGLAAWAGVLTVFARAFDAAGRSLGTVALLVPGDAPGLSLGAEALTMGMRAMPQSAVRFEAVFVPDAQVLGTPGAGMEVAHDAMGFARLGIGALCVGAMKRCLQLMARYAERRDIAGGRLIDNPVTLLRLHELDCAIGAAEALVDALAAGIDARRAAAAGGLQRLQVRAVRTAVGSGRPPDADAGRARLPRDQPGAAAAARRARAAHPRGAERSLVCAPGRAGAPARQSASRRRSRSTLRPRSRASLAPGWRELPAPGSGAWQDGRNGEFAAWTLLAATARGDAAPWARRRLDGLARTIRAEHAAAAACPPGSALLARVARHALAIGDVEQAAPGEAGRLDPFLRQAAPALVVEDVPVPEAPSSLELVRSCLQRWLREGGLGEGLPVKPGGRADGEEWSDTMPVTTRAPSCRAAPSRTTRGWRWRPGKNARRRRRGSTHVRRRCTACRYRHRRRGRARRLERRHAVQRPRHRFAGLGAAGARDRAGQRGAGQRRAALRLPDGAPAGRLS